MGRKRRAFRRSIREGLNLRALTLGRKVLRAVAGDCGTGTQAQRSAAAILKGQTYVDHHQGWRQAARGRSR